MAGKFGYDGAPTVSSDGGMLAANNLSDLTDASAGRSNLGLGTAATHPSTDFDAAGAAATAQTAAQGYADTGDAARILKSTRQLKTANYTAVVGDLVAADTTGGTFTVTIPAASGGKGRIVVKWIAGAVAPTIALSGSDHFNLTTGATSATPVLLNQGYQFESDGTSVWTVTADDLPLSSLALRTSHGLASGSYVIPISPSTSSTAVYTSQNGILRLAPVYLPAMTITRIGAEVTAAGSAGCTVRLAVYADSGSGLPGALVLDVGTIAGDSATVQEVTLGSSLVLAPGLYWLGGVVQGAPASPPTLRVPNAVTPTPGVLFSEGASLPVAGAVATGAGMSPVTGALPNPFVYSNNGSTSPPRLLFKVA